MERLKREPQQKKAFIEAKRKHPHDFAKQAELIVTARRPAGLPERFQPLFMADNNTRDPLDFFHQYPIERQRRLQAEAEQRREQQRQVTEETQQKRRREMENGRKTVQKLKQDAEERKIDQFGNATKRMWENALPVPIHLKGIITPNETEKDDGTIVHRSQVGIKVSYSFKI